jgi:tellurite methyltransferase
MSDLDDLAPPVGPAGERHAWRIPTDALPYKRTREFGEHDMPAALRHEHDTKAGVWGELVVLAGQLRFFELGPEVREHELGVGRHGLIEPQAPHRVEPGPGTRFYVVFHRRPG